MAFCSHCGKELESGAAFCSGCGADLRPIPATPEKPVSKVTGGIRGRGIASIALGGSALYFALFAWFFLLFQGVFTAVFAGEEVPLGVIFYVYVFLFSLFALACSIAGKILAGKALALLEGYKLAKIGNVLNLIGIILCAASLVLGLLIAMLSVV